MKDVSFLEVVSAAVPRGWRVSRPRGGPWVGARPDRSKIPAAGWKIHVSATVDSAAEMLRRALPLLVAEGVAFKVAASTPVVAALNEGEAGLAQVGKVLTVYPSTDDSAVRLAVALDEATRGLPGPRVASDRGLGAGSLVHYRYAAFTGRPDEPDPPAPTIDPFIEAGVAEPLARRAVAERYVPVTVLHRSAGGTVELAADLEAGRPCVLKRAFSDARVGPDGRDARDHLRHEAAVLERLSDEPWFPSVFGLVEDAGDLVLVLEHVAGQPIGAIAPRPFDEIVVLARRAAAAVAAVHRAGFAYRDLNPSNALVDAEGDVRLDVRLVDFELACPLGEVGERAGTPGFASPEQLAGMPAAASDDLYALGGLVWVLATGTDPGSAGVDLTDERLARIVERCRHDDPDERFASAEALDAALAELEETG